MKRSLFIAVFTILCAGSLFAGEEPIYTAVDVAVSPDFIIRDFSVYPYSSSYLMGYSRIYYTGKDLIEYVRLDCHLYKEGRLAGTTELYGDYETYGQNGMWPGMENYYSSYIDKVDFDSVAFSIAFHRSDGLKPRIDKEALIITGTAATDYGSSRKISGLVRNISASAISYPSILICIYKEGQMVQYCQAFADAPNHRLQPGQSAPFHSFIDNTLYDSIVYLSNTAIPERSKRGVPRIGVQTASNPVLFYLSQI